MTNGFTAGGRVANRMALSLLAASCLLVGSPLVLTGSAATGAGKPVSARRTDCRSGNTGRHNGDACPVSRPSNGYGGAAPNAF